MDIKLRCIFVIAALTLAACITPRMPANPDLAKWAKEYGYLPYGLHGQNVYCHGPVGFSGTFCVRSQELGNLMAKNEAPPAHQYVPNITPGGGAY
jgi:hypothetical protein